MSGGLSAGAFTFAAISTAATVAGGINSLVSGSPKASGSAANNEVNTASARAQTARSQLLQTAGGSAGDPLLPGQVSNPNTVFGN